MSYIGASPIVGNFQICDAISVVNGQAAYTMQVGSANVSPETANHMIVSLNGVIQKPNSAYTISGSIITFASNLASGDVIDFIQLLGDVLDIGTPSDATVSTAKIVDNAVTLAKMASGTDGNIISYDASGNPVAVATGSAGQILTSAGAGAVPSFQTVAGGLFVKTAGVDISAGGSVTLQNCFNSTYDNYFITFSRIRNASDAQCLFRPINSGGSGTATNAYTGLFYGQGYSNNFYGTDQTDVKLNENCGNDVGEALSGFMYFFNPISTVNSVGQYTWQLSSSHNGATNRFGVTWGGGVIGGTTSYTGFSVLFSTGNISSGEIAVYGIVNPV